MKRVSSVLALIFAVAPLCLDAQETVTISGQAADSIPPTKADSLYEITTTDGQTLSGYILEETDSTIMLKFQNAGKVTLERKSVQSMKLQRHMIRSNTGQLWHRDANRTRYLYSPSAMMLRHGEGNFSQKQLLFSAAGIGITDYVNLQLGGAVPFWFLDGGKGFNLILGAKVGAPVTKKIHLAAGIQTFFIPEAEGALNLPFGAFTVGDDKAHVTFSASSPFFTGSDESGFGELMWFALSGNIRMSKRVALVSENWFFRIDAVDETSDPVFSLAARIFGERMAVDIGAFFFPGATIPIPWLDFTYNFGL